VRGRDNLNGRDLAYNETKKDNEEKTTELLKLRVRCGEIQSHRKEDTKNGDDGQKATREKGKEGDAAQRLSVSGWAESSRTNEEMEQAAPPARQLDRGMAKRWPS
jgi:hypothetical protein